MQLNWLLIFRIFFVFVNKKSYIYKQKQQQKQKNNNNNNNNNNTNIIWLRYLSLLIELYLQYSLHLIWSQVVASCIRFASDTLEYLYLSSISIVFFVFHNKNTKIFKKHQQQKTYILIQSASLFIVFLFLSLIANMSNLSFLSYKLTCHSNTRTSIINWSSKNIVHIQ